jgi:hypothetical protein
VDAARERRKLAVKGHRKFSPDASTRKPRAPRPRTDSADTNQGAAALIAALEGAPPPEVNDGGSAAPAAGEFQSRAAEPAGAPPSTTAATTGAPPPEGWADDVHTAGEAGAAKAAAQAAEETPAEPPHMPSDDEIAGLAVDGQMWVSTEWARYKVFPDFQPPPLPEEGRNRLAAQWKPIIRYTGLSMLLPPWVTQLVIPGVILLTTTVAMAKGFAIMAEDQKRKATGAPADAAGTAAA